MKFMTREVLLIAAMWALAGCGGGGGNSTPLGGNPGTDPGGGMSSGGSGGIVGGNNGYIPGIFNPSSTYAKQCAAPRAGTDDQSGSTFTENMFLRSWTNDLYLWYGEVPDTNPRGLSTEEYFQGLKTPLTTPSGRAKDQFHFTYPTAAWEELSEGGIEVGYGAQWVILAQRPPRKVVIAFVEPGSPAATQDLSRGGEVLTADGVDVINADTDAAVDQLNAAFFPVDPGEQHVFTIRYADGQTRIVTLTSSEITHQPVLMSGVINQSGVPVGYLVFNDHIATAEGQLRTAVNALGNAGIQDLVLDLRYNGGGYLAIASQLAYMIAGNSRTSGQTFEKLVFNDKHPNTNPVTGQPLEPTPFHTTTLGFSGTVGVPLPRLNLERVYVITSNNTCSASEAIINGLRGVDVQVYQIGSTTCGKPYGFYPQDNCGTTYFSIQFQGLNAKDEGNYSDGFAPANSQDAASIKLPGCSVADDFTRQLGDPLEGRLAAALAFRASNNTVCPAASGAMPIPGVSAKQSLSRADGIMFKSPARENRIMRKDLGNSLSF
ncbi:MAG TPA: S41 family peptidase [Steroidobacter sp.]|uniref:S41 family peptidase n=1 Tax=Steroidobacter sp. TaxID=1978227 RepID=UPI002EDB188B